MKLKTTLATAGAALMLATAGFAQTSDGASTAPAAKPGGDPSQVQQPYDLASEMTCEEFLILDTPDQGRVLVELLPTSTDAANDPASQDKGMAQPTGGDTTASATDNGSAMPATGASGAGSSDMASGGAAGTAASATGSDDGQAMPAGDSDVASADDASGQGGTDGQSADQPLPALVTGVFEHCQTNRQARVSDGVSQTRPDGSATRTN